MKTCLQPTARALDYQPMSKAEVIRELAEKGSMWHYVSYGTPDDFDLLFVIESLCDYSEKIKRSGYFVELRSYTATNRYRVVSNTGSVLDLGPHEQAYRFDYGIIVENKDHRWAYLKAADLEAISA